MNEQAPTSPGTEYEQLLVEAARADVPPPGARQQMLAAIGISASAGLAGAKAAAATAAPGIGAASASAVLVKALVWGTIAGVVGMGLAHGWPKQTANKPGNADRFAASATAAVPTLASAAVLEPSVSVEPTPELERHLVPPKAHASSSAPEPESNQVLLERQLLDGARKALTAGRASSATKLLNEYTRTFGFGILGHEATVLRMEALRALGRSQEAQQLGRRYLAEHPHGAQVAAVRRLLGSAETNATPAPAESDQKSEQRQ